MAKPRQIKPEEQDDTAESKRLTAPQIFHAVAENGRSELSRSSQTLAFSAIAGGITMGLTGLSVASVHALVGIGGWEQLVSYLVYPVGFIAVIIGRAQLFTENTLYPVILVLDEHRYFFQTLRLWGVVFSCNILGAFLFALLAVKTSALSPDILFQLVHLGIQAANGSAGHLFWSAVVGGWLIALVAWVVTASHWTIGQLAMVWLLTLVVGIGKFAHCIASSGEIISAVVAGALPVGAYFHWLLPAVLGNIVGGVVIVSVLNYGQVKEV
ncbi:MAG: formate/nitrite transporter family protein [Terriglobales bacterium]